MNFGQLIRNRRKQKDWTIKQLVSFSDIKRTPNYMGMVEMNKFIPSSFIVCKIASVLDIDREQLLRLAKEEKIKLFSDKIDEEIHFALIKYGKVCKNDQ